MPYCQNCGQQVADGASFCSFCGRPFAVTSSHVSSSGDLSNPNLVQPTNSGILESKDIVMSKKIFSLREHYDFSAVDGTRLGEGDGNLFQLPARFVVLDSNKAEVMHIVGKVLSIRHEYALFDNAGNNFGSIKKKIMKLIGEEYWLEQNGVELMRIHGDFTEHDYRMEINKRPVAAVHKKWISIRDQFSISITGQVDPRLVIGSAIVVEHIEVTERQNKSGSGFGIRFL